VGYGGRLDVEQRRAAVGSWLSWCQTSKRWPAPGIPSDCERRPEPANAASDLPKTTIDRVLARRDVPLREKALWRMRLPMALGGQPCPHMDQALDA
jgi:hypothetical protein